MATHVFLESCARKEVGICFVGECWVALAGSRTQSNPDYVMLGNASKGTKVVVFVRRDLVDAVRLVAATARAVVVEVGGYRVGGVYGKCGVGVHAMEYWLGTLDGWIGGEIGCCWGIGMPIITRGHWMGSRELGAGCWRSGSWSGARRSTLGRGGPLSEGEGGRWCSLG